MDKNSENERLDEDLPKDEEEVEALLQFKSEVSEWVDEGVDDYFFLKWLRARDLDIEQAKDMLRKYLDWRKMCNYITEISNSYTPPDVITENIRAAITGKDYYGRPVFYLHAGRINLKSLFDQDYKEDIYRFAHFILEKIVEETEKSRKEHGVAQVVAIIDFENIALTSPMHTQTVQLGLYAVRVFEAYYPELLYKLICINTSWVFSSLYSVLKPFLSLKTGSKIEIYSYDKTIWENAIRKYVGDEALPVEYDGSYLSVSDPKFKLS